MKVFSRAAPIAKADRAERDLRAVRAAAARRCSTWTEIEQPIQRGSFYVDTADRILVRYRGAVWERGSAKIISLQPLFFSVAPDGEVEVFERSVIAHTWTDYCERKARIAARTRVPL